MRKQVRVFHQPFRNTYRPYRRPRLLQMTKAKRRKGKQEFRRRKTVRLSEGSATKSETIAWSTEQLERIWQNTAG